MTNLLTRAIAILAAFGLTNVATVWAAPLGAHQKIIRVLPGKPFGDGRDGALTVSATGTQSLTARSCSGAQGSTSLSLTSAGFANGDVVLIHQSRGTGAGAWEINKVVAGGGTTTLTLAETLHSTYADVGASQAQVVRIPMYTDVTINFGVTWSVSAWNGDVGGILLFAAKETTTVAGTISANGSTGGERSSNGNTSQATGGGFRGGYGRKDSGASTIIGQSGEGSVGAAVAQTSAQTNNGSGGGGGYGGSRQSAAGGGHAGTGGSGRYCPGGSAVGTADLSTMVFGGAGGGASHKTDGEWTGGGGSSAGIVAIFSEALSISGAIRLNGGMGGANGRSSGTGGGGGSGGACLVQAESVTLAGSSITASGGAGGSCPGGYNGGAGSAGRIAIHYSGTVTGSTSPGYTGQFDSDLIANQIPVAFSLTSPANLSWTANNKPTFTWEASTDPEGLPITYTLQLSTNPEFTEPLYRTVADLEVTTYTPGTGSELGDNTYYWRVVASDGELTTISSQSWELAVDTLPPDSPTITAFLADAQTGQFAKLHGTAEAGSNLTFYRWDQATANYVAINGNLAWDGNLFSFEPTGMLDSGSTLYIASTDSALNSAESRVVTASFERAFDVFRDSATYHGSGPGSSMRIQKDGSYSFKIAANGGQPITVSAWLRKNSHYTGSAPRLTLSGMGISGTGAATAAMTAGADTWQQVTVTGTPNAAGVLTLKFESFSTASGSASWIDDVAVSQ